MPDVPTSSMFSAPMADAGKGARHQLVRTPRSIVSDPDYPAETNVRDGVDYGNGIYLGDLELPAVSDVKTGIQYGANGTEFTGTLVSRGTSAHAHAW